MATNEDITADERRAYELIVERDGLVQSELWKTLDVDSRAGSRLARGLAEKSLIEREPMTKDGRRTYRLTAVDGDALSSLESSDDSEATSTASAEEAAESLEDEALSLILDRGGLYQSELWKALDVDSRTGSRIATSLESDDRIRRVEATYDGQRTYRLLPAKADLDFSLLMAGDLISPLIGSDGDLDPIDSPEMTRWIMELFQE